MSSDFHVKPRELNLRTLHCLFDQSQVALQCLITCIPTCSITMFSFSAKHNVLKVSFQIPSHPTRRFILFYSILLDLGLAKPLLTAMLSSSNHFIYMTY